SSAAAEAAIRRAFSRPRAPVATLLHLLFATMARRRPALMVSRPSVAGEPGNWQRVEMRKAPTATSLTKLKTAAAAGTTSRTKMARSLAEAFRPQLRLAQRTPRGKTGGSWNEVKKALVF